MSTTVVLLMGVSVLVGGILAWLWRGAEARALASDGRYDELQAERDELASRLSRESQSRKKQAEELATFRKRADKAKKRSARAEKGAKDLPLGTAARMADLEVELERTARERDRSRTEREQLAEQVAQLEAKQALAEQKPVAPPAAPAMPAATDSDALTRELAEAREQTAKLSEAVSVAKETEARMRKRMSNQEQLYASVRAELDVKKDRLRTQEEQIQRLQALKVAVSD